MQAEVDQSLEKERSEDSAATSSTVQPSDTVDAANQNLCFFVIKKKKQYKSKIEPLRTSEKDKFGETILSNILSDIFYQIVMCIYNETSMKIQSILSSKVYYHDVCRQSFRNQKRSLVKSPVRTSWHISREIHDTVYKEICM